MMMENITAKNLLEDKNCSNCRHKSQAIPSECWRTYDSETDHKNWEGKYWRPRKPEGSCEEWDKRINE